MKDAHVAPGIEQHAAVGRGHGGIDVDVATAARDDIAPGRSDRRVDVDVAKGVHGQRRRFARRRPGDGFVDEDVAIAAAGVARQRDRADGDAVVDQLCRQRRTGNIAAGADDEVGGIDQPAAGCPERCGGGDANVVGHIDARRRCLDEAAIAATGCTRIEHAGNRRRAAAHVAAQENAALATLERLRFDDAAVVHGGAKQGPGGVGGHDDPAAVGAKQAAVADKGIDRAGIDRDGEQAIAGEIKRDDVTRGEDDRPEIGLDQAIVVDGGTKQRDLAATGVDHAVVADRAAAAAETVIAGHEVGIGDAERRCDKAADVDAGALAEQDAVAIDDEHPAVGGQAAENDRWIAADDAVERHRAAVRLGKDDMAVLADRETLPVDHRALAGLGDGHRRRIACDAGVADADGAAARQGLCAGRSRRAKHEQAQQRAGAARAEQTGFAAPLDGDATGVDAIGRGALEIDHLAVLRVATGTGRIAKTIGFRMSSPAETRTGPPDRGPMSRQLCQACGRRSPSAGGCRA